MYYFKGIMGTKIKLRNSCQDSFVYHVPSEDLRHFNWDVLGISYDMLYSLSFAVIYYGVLLFDKSIKNSHFTNLSGPSCNMFNLLQF